MNIDLVKSISNDLKILRYSDESIERYQSRIIYSAISYWIRVNTISNEYNSHSGVLNGVSKHKNTIDCSNILRSFLQVFPNSLEWFCDKKIDEIINNIRTVLESVGEIIYRDGKLILVNKESDVFNRMFNRTNIIQETFEHGYVSGMTWFHDYDVLDNIEFNHYINISPKEFANIMKKNVEFHLSNYEGNYEVFIPKKNTRFYYSWYDARVVIEDKVYLARKKTNNIYDFYWYQKSNRKTLISKISDFFKCDFEINRIMLGISEIEGFTNCVKLTKFQEANVFIFHLPNNLPNFERRIIEATCWPLVSFEDKHNFVANLNVYFLIEKLLSRLNLVFIEGDCDE